MVIIAISRCVHQGLRQPSDLLIQRQGEASSTSKSHPGPGTDREQRAWMTRKNKRILVDLLEISIGRKACCALPFYPHVRSGWSATIRFAGSAPHLSHVRFPASKRVPSGVRLACMRRASIAGLVSKEEHAQAWDSGWFASLVQEMGGLMRASP